MPPAASRRRCKCPACCALDPEGRDIPERTYFRHKANQYPAPIPGSSKFRCTYCPHQYPDGHLVSFSTFLRHKKKARTKAPDESQPPPFVDSPLSPHSAGQLASVQLPDIYRTPTRPHVQETDDAFDADGTDECAHPPVSGQTSSTEEEFDTEMQDHETLEQLCSVLDAILMEDNADEADSNSDNDAMNDKDTDIDPNPDDLTFVKLAKLRSKGMSREMYEEVRRIIRTFKIELPNLRRSESRLQHWTKIQPELVDCCVNSCIAYTGTFRQASMCPHCNAPRYSPSGRPRNRFLYVPVAHRLALQYSDAGRARVLKSYRLSYSKPLQDAGRHQLRDIFDGALYHDFHLRELGLFGDPHDIALLLSLDGVQVTNLKNHEV